MYEESDYLLLSGLQHLCFCPRQCALIHVEQLWSENFFTAEGRVLHEKVHSGITESRKSIKIERNLKIASRMLGITGQTDAVEFYSDGTVIPIEYKHGKEKTDSSDLVQLCAQVLCLEEMLDIHITSGAMYYFKTRKRILIDITDELRHDTVNFAIRFHELVNKGETPSAVYSKKCESCSFLENCFPQSAGVQKSVSKYIKNQLEKELTVCDDL